MHTKRPKSRTKWRTKTVWSAEKVKKGEKSEKSSWQKGWGCSIIWRLTARAGEDIAQTEPRTSRKKLEKSFEKGIDKRGRKWYNNKVARKRGKLIIENWTTREKYKANSLKRISENSYRWEYYSTKVKEAKSKTRKQRDWITERSVFWYNDFESLILAQDERWRRA